MSDNNRTTAAMLDLRKQQFEKAKAEMDIGSLVATVMGFLSLTTFSIGDVSVAKGGEFERTGMQPAGPFISIGNDVFTTFFREMTVRPSDAVATLELFGGNDEHYLLDVSFSFGERSSGVEVSNLRHNDDYVS